MEEACNLTGAWTEPKLIIPAFIALILSGAFPLLLQKFKVKREVEEKRFTPLITMYCLREAPCLKRSCIGIPYEN